MDVEHKTIDVADFAANCSKIIEDLDRGAVQGVDVTRDGKVVAQVRPARKPLHGYLRGTVKIPDGFDLTAPVFEEPTHAEQGRVHE